MTAHAQHSTDRPRVHLRNLSLRELREFVTGHEMPEYRYRQLAAWLYGKLADDLSVMSDLPLEFRERLAEGALVRSSRVAYAEIPL